MRKNVDQETQEIIDSFVAEASERLDEAEIQLEGLGTEDDTARLNSVFRLFHSVKGSAGYLGFENVKRLTHEAETLLELYIKSRRRVDEESQDLIFKTIDRLREIVAIVVRDNADEAAAQLAADQTTRLAQAHEQLRASPASENSPSPPRPEAPKAVMEAAPTAISPTPIPSMAAPAGEPSSAGAAPPANAIILSELVTAEMVERFLAESADLVDEVERRLLSNDAEGDSGLERVNQIFRAIHTIKGNAGFFGHACLEQLCMALESHLDRARRGEIPLNEALTNSIIERIDAIRSAIAGVAILQEDGKPAAVADGKASAPATPRGTTERYRPLGEILVDLGTVREEDVKRALELQERPLGEILVESGLTGPGEIEKALEIQRAAAGGAEHGAEEIKRKEIRVDTAKLDKLFELVGELITAEAMVLNSPDLAGLKLDGFHKSFSGLSKISREIQETAMMIRMIPLEGLFHKMTRLVRDLSRKFDKPVNFSSLGQETEMDKNVIEQVSDPLVHILRNALDHGLESQEVRTAAGKPAAGSIRLEARYEGSEIWISVRDDGAGLDRERILAKALEKGLLKADAASLPDEEVWKLIFEPGFSTAAVVTEVSGRGVGLDVVKKNLERIRGRVDIKTKRGEGAEFILKIPLTMAIIDGITVRSGSNRYSIPLGDILEFFKVQPSQLTRTADGGETINLRGSILPLVKLGKVFDIPGAELDPGRGTVIVIQSAGRRACLLIDEVIGNQQIVIKSLSEYLGHIDGISGCSILGDGTVSFILDTARLLAKELE